jgi:hypothetical protein
MGTALYYTFFASTVNKAAFNEQIVGLVKGVHKLAEQRSVSVRASGSAVVGSEANRTWNSGAGDLPAMISVSTTPTAPIATDAAMIHAVATHDAMSDAEMLPRTMSSRLEEMQLQLVKVQLQQVTQQQDHRQQQADQHQQQLHQLQHQQQLLMFAAIVVALSMRFC